MKIFYDQITDEGLDIECSFSFSDGDEKFEVKKFNGNIIHAGDAYVLDGAIEFSFFCSCDRCLAEVAMDFTDRVTLTLSPIGDYPESDSDDEKCLSDDEAGMYVTPTDHFDVEEFIREEIILNAPIKRLCSDDCAGLCPSCGVDLNNEECRCTTNENSPFSALSKLKEKK